MVSFNVLEEDLKSILYKDVLEVTWKELLENGGQDTMKGRRLNAGVLDKCIRGVRGAFQSFDAHNNVV